MGLLEILKRRTAGEITKLADQVRLVIVTSRESGVENIR